MENRRCRSEVARSNELEGDLAIETGIPRAIDAASRAVTDRFDQTERAPAVFGGKPLAGLGEGDRPEDWRSTIGVTVQVRDPGHDPQFTEQRPHVRRRRRLGAVPVHGPSRHDGVGEVLEKVSLSHRDSRGVAARGHGHAESATRPRAASPPPAASTRESR